jgi:hypothetical protein
MSSSIRAGYEAAQTPRNERAEKAECDLAALRETFSIVSAGEIKARVRAERAERDLAEARAKIERQAKCLGFFASVIKSGEPWKDACEIEYRAALSETTTDGKCSTTPSD